jgi:hypothetical protein
LIACGLSATETLELSSSTESSGGGLHVLVQGSAITGTQPPRPRSPRTASTASRPVVHGAEAGAGPAVALWDHDGAVTIR